MATDYLIQCPTCFTSYDFRDYQNCPSCSPIESKVCPNPNMICPKCNTEFDGRWLQECPKCGSITKPIRMDKMYMDIAVRVSEMSRSERSKVGAVLVNNGNIISFGWNGMPSGMDNCCEIGDGSTKPEVIHAEMNIFSKLARSGGCSDGATLYLTLSPCYECSKLIIQSGVVRVVYRDEYRISEPIEFLRSANVAVHKFDN